MLYNIAEDEYNTINCNKERHIIEIFFKSDIFNNKKRSLKDFVRRQNKDYISLDTKLGNTQGLVGYCDGIVITDTLDIWKSVLSLA